MTAEAVRSHGDAASEPPADAHGEETTGAGVPRAIRSGGQEKPVEADEHERSRARPEEIFEKRLDTRTIALVGLLVLGVFYTLYFARPVLFPVVLAILLSFVLDPIVGALGRLRIPRGVAAGIVLLGLVAGGGFAVYRLSGPAADWLEQAPRNFAELERKLARIKEPVQDVERATKEVEKIASITGDEGRDPEEPEQVRVSEPSLGQTLVSRMRAFLTDGVVTLVLVFFLLASGDLFLRRLAKVLPSLRAKKRAVRVARHVRSDISAYLLTLSLINVGLAAAVTGTMWLLDMPTPLLWGVMAGFLNFVPYLGPLVGMVIVALASLLTFEELGRAALPPLAYLLLNTMEGSFVTPAIMGRRFSLNPVAVFISLLLWGWIWGIPGALMAVPLVVTAKIFCDHYEPLSALGEFLGRA